jgi:ATP/maltotriose-dependent transcriptional regulator MalT
VRIYWAQQLLAAEASETVRARLLSAVADLHNLAGWTSFDCGQVGAAYHHLARALDWARFHDETDLTAMTGVVHAELGDTRQAIPALSSAIERFGAEMARSRTFCLIALASCHFLDGDLDEGQSVGKRAMGSARELRSERVWDRSRPMAQEAAARGVPLR